MNNQPVVAAVDGSPDGLRALEWALDAARRHGTTLRVLHVRTAPPRVRQDVRDTGPPAADDDPVLIQARARVDALGGIPSVEYVVTEGAPGALLPETGAEARLLVLGSRGRGGFASLLLGSNSWPPPGTPGARWSWCPGRDAAARRRRGSTGTAPWSSG